MKFKRLFTKKKHYDYIISLGYNCEVTYKFLKYYKFEVSNLFNWTYCNSINDLINALKNFDKIGCGNWQNPNPLWECSNSKIRFHGKVSLNRYINNTISEEEIDADKKDLISRIKYLKEKFLKIAKSEKKKLYIYKIKSQDIDNSINSKILDLLNVLKLLGVNNFELLIVAEKKNSEMFKNHSNEYIVDFVDYFPPDDDVTGKKYRKNGWHKIFNKLSVLKPQNYTKKKKYKYEGQVNILKTKYDLIFSIGEACSCTETLRKSRLQFYSYPMDWLFGASFVDRCKILASGFDNWLVKENLEKIGDNNISKIPKHIYRNNLTGICFNHDFPQNLPLEESFIQVKQKYDRRINRLLEHIEKSKKVLVVYIQTPNNQNKLSKEDLLKGYSILNKKFEDKFNLLYLYCDSKYSLKNRIETNLSDNIKCISYDYNAYNKELPYVVNQKKLLPIFNRIIITNKFLTNKNKLERFRYKVKFFFKGKLWEKFVH